MRLSNLTAAGLVSGALISSPANASYMQHWVDTHGGCRSYSAVNVMPSPTQDRTHFGLPSEDWKPTTLDDYEAMRATCRAEARTGVPGTTPNPEDLQFGASKRLEITERWIEPRQRDSSQPATPPADPISSTGRALSSADSGAQTEDSLMSHFRSVSPVGNRQLLSNIAQFGGKDVRASNLRGCFAYGEKYICTSTVSGELGSILVIADEMKSDLWGQVIGSRCGNLHDASLHRCHVGGIGFHIDDFGTDMSGTTRIIHTKTIYVFGAPPM